MPYSKHECWITWDKPKKTQRGHPKAKPPQRSTTAISPKLVQKSPNQHKLVCLRVSSPYLEEFPYLHLPFKGFLNKTISIPNPWNFPKTTSPRSEILWKPKPKPRMNPITTWLFRKWLGKAKTNVNPGKSHANDTKITCKPIVCTMHSNPNKQITHATCYLQNLVVN